MGNSVGMRTDMRYFMDSLVTDEEMKKGVDFLGFFLFVFDV